MLLPAGATCESDDVIQIPPLTPLRPFMIIVLEQKQHSLRQPFPLLASAHLLAVTAQAVVGDMCMWPNNADGWL